MGDAVSQLDVVSGRRWTLFVGFRPAFSLNYSHARPIEQPREYISDLVRAWLARWRAESASVSLLSLVIAVANEIRPACRCRGKDLRQRRVQLPTLSCLLIVFRRMDAPSPTLNPLSDFVSAILVRNMFSKGSGYGLALKLKNLKKLKNRT